MHLDPVSGHIFGRIPGLIAQTRYPAVLVIFSRVPNLTAPPGKIWVDTEIGRQSEINFFWCLCYKTHYAVIYGYISVNRCQCYKD